MLAPPPLPRTLEASLRDLSSVRPATRASSIPDLVRHARGDAAVRKKALPLLERALSDEVPEVRVAAAIGLGDLAASEVLPSLLVAIEDADPHVRQVAINALGEIEDPRAAPRLERGLKDKRPEVRYQSLIAFARVARTDALAVGAALANGAADKDDSIQYIALRLAEERIDAGAREGLDALRERARGLLEHGPKHVQVVAAIVLAKSGDGVGRDLLLRVIDGTVSLPRGAKEDEREAVELAGALDLKEAIPALERRAFGFSRRLTDTCAYHARIALARLGHDRARRELLAELGSRDRSVREAAVVAVGRARLVEARSTLASMREESVDPELLRTARSELDGP